MIITANYAIHDAPGRLEALRKSVESIINQVDVVRIYWNAFSPDRIPEWFVYQQNIVNWYGEDYTDNGKFFAMYLIENEYYFTCDGDILYPEEYVYKTLGMMVENDLKVISYHGRQIVTDHDWESSYYYGGHRIYSYLNEIQDFVPVDIVGTGVCCTDTRFFKPNIARSKHKCMSDLVFSLEAAKKGIDLFVAPHPTGWFEPIRLEGNIYNTFKNKDQSEQVGLVKEIYKFISL
jgi:hypothetical protein